MSWGEEMSGGAVTEMCARMSRMYMHLHCHQLLIMTGHSSFRHYWYFLCIVNVEYQTWTACFIIQGTAHQRYHSL